MEMDNMALKNSYRPELTKSYLVVFILAKVVGHLFGCKLVPFNNAGNQPNYPYVTYHPITTHNYSTSDYRPDQYYVQFQIDCHAIDAIQASDMAIDLLEALTNRSGYRYWFEQANVVPSPLDEKKSNIQDHTTLPGINYDNSYGFYFNFLISHADTVYKMEDLNFDFNESNIESIQVDGSVGNQKMIINDEKEETK